MDIDRDPSTVIRKSGAVTISVKQTGTAPASTNITEPPHVGSWLLCGVNSTDSGNKCFLAPRPGTGSSTFHTQNWPFCPCRRMKKGGLMLASRLAWPGCSSLAELALPQARKTPQSGFGETKCENPGGVGSCSGCLPAPQRGVLMPATSRWFEVCCLRSIRGKGRCQNLERKNSNYVCPGLSSNNIVLRSGEGLNYAYLAHPCR